CGQLIRSARSADGEGIDEFALVVRLPELKNNLHAWPVLRVIRFCDHGDCIKFCGRHNELLAVRLPKVCDALVRSVGAVADGLDPNMADREQDWTGFNVAAIVVVR